MTEEARKSIITIFQNNIGNKLTVELCNGMVQAVIQTIEQEVKTDD